MDPRRKKKSGARQWILAAAVAILAVAVMPLLHYFQDLKAKRAVPPALPAPRAVPAAPVVAAPVARPTPTPVPPDSQGTLLANAEHPYERGAYYGQLKVAEARAKLELTEEEHMKLLDEVVDFENVRAEVEQPLVAVDSFDGTKLVLKIPAYPDQGKTIRDALLAQIGQDFPPERAAEIEAGLNGYLDTLFCGFGKFPQAFTVTQLDGDRDQFDVTRTATPADPAETPDAATAAELGQISTGGGGDRGGVLDEWRAIAPQITSHFPPRAQPAAPPPQQEAPKPDGSG